MQELAAYKRKMAEEEQPLAGYSSRNVSAGQYQFPGEEATGYKGARGEGRYV